MSSSVIKAERFTELFASEGGTGGSGAAGTRFRSPQARVRELEVELARVRTEAEEAVAAAAVGAREETLAEARADYGEAAATLRATAAELDRVCGTGLGVAQNEIITLAMAVAGKVLRREIARDDEFVVRLVRRCLGLIVRRSAVRLRVHPADHERVLAELDSLVNATNAGHEIIVQADQRVDRGSCVAETPDFVIDGTLSSQLAAADHALKGDGA